MSDLLNEFDAFLNEPPSGESSMGVREYRYQAFAKWGPVRNRISELEAANAKMRKALLGLLKFHQEGDDGAELPREFWSGNYLDAVEAAEEVLK